ncbi:MAG: hypothetical protein ABSC53_14135 [Bacteroidota bacterium]
MENQSSLSIIIPLFQSVEERFRNNNLEFALSGVRSILANDPKNFYAIAIERRLKRVLDLQQKPSAASNATEHSRARMIAALEHVCHMAVQQLTKLSAQASVHDMSNQLREQALENKYQALLHRARQQFHIQEYERALQEAKRARIIRPDSAEADALILEIKTHMATPAVKEKQQARLEDAAKEKNGKPKQTRELKNKTAIERPEVVTEKILSSISFADYHRTNADYAVCLQYIEQGLELDPSNEVLLQMKEEVEKAVMKKFSENESSYQLV